MLCFSCVVLKANVNELQEYVHYVAELKETFGISPSLGFASMLSCNSVMDEMVVPYNELSIAVKGAIDLCDSYEIPVHFRHIPFCYMKGYEHKAGEMYAQNWYLTQSGDRILALQKRSAPACETCKMTTLCSKFPERYLGEVDDLEVRPF